MLGSKAFSGQNVRTRGRPSLVRMSGVSKVAGIARPVSARVHRRARAGPVRVQANLFANLFGPKADAPAPPQAQEIVEELIDTVSSGRASAADVSDLVKQLQPFGVKNPVRSKLLFGEYKLVYSSKPISGAPRQILEEPDVIREVSQIKALGLLPGTSTQSGELNGLNNDTYEESFTRLDVKSPLGGESRDIDVVRTVTVLYLDRELRIVRTKAENESGEGSLAVYQRVDADEDGDDEAAAPKKQGTGMVFFGGAAKESTATLAERDVRKRMAAEEAKAGKAGPRMPANLPATPAAAVAARSGTARIGTGRVSSPPPSPAPRRGTVQVEAKGGAVDAKRKEAEAKAKEIEAKNRAKEAAAAKEKADADKRAAIERSSAIKAQLEELSVELKEAQAEAREAAKEAKDLERSNGVVLKQVAGARQQLRSAAGDVSEVEEALSKAGAARAAAESALKEALAGVNAAQSQVRAATSRK